MNDLRGAAQQPAPEPVACHVFNVTVTGRLHEWEPTTFAFALRDGKHALYTAPPRCPNCDSLEAQNNELDRRLAEMEQDDWK